MLISHTGLAYMILNDRGNYKEMIFEGVYQDLDHYEDVNFTTFSGSYITFALGMLLKDIFIPGVLSLGKWKETFPAAHYEEVAE